VFYITARCNDLIDKLFMMHLLFVNLYNAQTEQTEKEKEKEKEKELTPRCIPRSINMLQISIV